MNATLQCLASTPALQQYLAARTVGADAHGLGARDGPASLTPLRESLRSSQRAPCLCTCHTASAPGTHQRQPRLLSPAHRPRSTLNCVLSTLLSNPASCAGWRPSCRSGRWRRAAPPGTPRAFPASCRPWPHPPGSRATSTCWTASSEWAGRRTLTSSCGGCWSTAGARRWRGQACGRANPRTVTKPRLPTPSLAATSGTSA